MPTPPPYRATADAPATAAALHARTYARRRTAGLVAAGALIAAAGVAVVRARRAPPSAPGDAPPELLANDAVFPRAESDLPPATPLAPLLAADEPEQLAVLEPSERAVSIARGERVTVRFNRPMVERSRVGRAAVPSPLQLVPAVPGVARWISRSAVAFEPAPAAWARTHEAQLTLDPSLRSLAGESLADDTARTVVFDASPHLVDRSGTRVATGAPLPLYFDGPVDTAELGTQLLAYQSGGVRRALRFSLGAGGLDARGRTRVNLRLARALEAGANVAVAVAPTLLGDGSGDDRPDVLAFEIAPPPRIEGVGCPANATSADQCGANDRPGRIVGIAETLRLLSTTPLAPLAPDAVRVTPELPGLTATITGNTLALRGEWSPGQVYEVRIAGLVDTEGHALARMSPLAVRSAGLAPAVHAPAGRLTFERASRAELPFAAVHVDQGAIRLAPVRPGEELAAALQLATTGGAEQPLAPLVPESRANRWGRGRFTWLDAAAGRASTMALVTFLPEAPPTDGASARGAVTALVQSTDLAITARILPRGVLAWVTSLATARPVSGAQVSLGSATQLVGGARTDDEGLAWIAFAPGFSAQAPLALRAVRDDDRAVLVLDLRTAVSPSALGLSAGAASSAEGAPVASVFADRGAYRPGETVRVKVVARTVAGEALRALAQGAVRVRLMAPDGDAPVAEQRASLSAFGTADTELTLGAGATVGEYVVEVYRDGVAARIGATTVQVAEFRQPTFRVDLAVQPGTATDGEPLRASVHASYLFGAPVGNATARWSFTRAPSDEPPAPAWREYLFAPADGVVTAGTVDEGTATLDAQGNVEISTRIATGATARQRVTLEAEVREAAGQELSSKQSFLAFPAAYEVGVHRGADWVALGTALDFDTVLVTHEGAPVANRALEARVVREAWQGYYEWAGRGRNGDGDGESNGEDATGTYQPRRARDRVTVHSCALRSGAAPVRCAFTPERPGTYVLEVTALDERGRAAVASRRVYVAGPDERPDRDPPGAPIAVTPSRRAWAVGERARVAFESPWPDAEALLTVEREGVLHRERRRVSAGGNVWDFELTPAMAPNAFVSVVLARPRSGPAGAALDAGAPDLRLGAAELQVRPRAAPLAVALGLPTGPVTPGSEVEIALEIHGADGRGVRSEVALYAVDEGTLRLTSYATPDPTAGLFPRRAPQFAVEDLRRTLTTRIELPTVAPSGDGSDEAQAPHGLRDDRERVEPLALWQPHVRTDANGHARVRFTLPDRPTQYRVMAVAVDNGTSAGTADGTLTASRPVVLRPALPRALIDGDRFEATVFVHNDATRPRSVELRTTVNNTAQPPRTLTLAAGETQRVGAWVDVHTAGAPLEVRFEARADDGGDRAAARIDVAPRGRAAHSQSVGMVRGARELAVALPPGALTAGLALRFAVATHPFVGFDTAVEALLTGFLSGAEPLAARLAALAADDALDADPRPGRMTATERRARGEAAVAQLVALQNSAGSFGNYAADDEPSRTATVHALRALEAARRRNWRLPGDSRERALRWLSASLTSDFSSDSPADELALALRAVAEAGAPDPARAIALYDRRERLSPAGLAHLALALDPSDRRRDTLALAATRRALATPEQLRRDPRLYGPLDPSPRTYGPLLEAAARIDAALPSARVLASRLLALRTGDGGATWGAADADADALAGLAAYAARFRGTAPLDADVTLDGAPLTPSVRTRDAMYFTLPAARLAPASPHRLRVRASGTAFYALGGSWYEALGVADETPRGSVAALHRVLESEDGRPLAPGATVRLGERVRVRLFLFTEGQPPPFVTIRSALGGGFDALDAGLDTTPRASLDALLGASSDDDVALDPRGFHAARSLTLLAHRAFLPGSVLLDLAEPTAGLHEFTYAVRATSVGTFVLPPAELAARYNPAFVARSAVETLTVTP